MLFLLFQLGKDQYAIPAKNICGVVSFANLKKIPGAPEGIAGVLNYHGKAVPIADLVRLASGQDATPSLSTRLILVNFGDESSSVPALGLIAEKVTTVRDFDESAFIAPTVKSINSPWLGKIASGETLIQWIKPGEIFSPEVLESLLLPELTGIDS